MLLFCLLSLLNVSAIFIHPSASKQVPKALLSQRSTILTLMLDPPKLNSSGILKSIIIIL